MSLTRLGTLDPELARRVLAAPEAACRSLAAGAAEAALSVVGAPADERLLAAREAVRLGNVGDSHVRSALQTLVEELDEAAWDIQDQVEAGRRPYEEYQSAFERARAINALWFALDPDPRVAAGEACYEALAAGVDADQLALLATG